MGARGNAGGFVGVQLLALHRFATHSGNLCDRGVAIRTNATADDKGQLCGVEGSLQRFEDGLIATKTSVDPVMIRSDDGCMYRRGLPS